MSRRNSELFLAGKKLTRNYFLASQRRARWEGRRLDPGCLKLTGRRLKSCEGNLCVSHRGNPSGTPVHPALVSSPETLDVAGEARRETRAKQAKPVGFEAPRSLGETRAKQGGPVGNLVQRCTPALALRQETSKKSGPRATQRKLLVTGNPAAGIVFKILRKPTRHLDRVQNLGFGPLGERRLLGSVAVYNTLHRGHPGHPDIPLRPLFPPSNLLPVLRGPTCDKASCGIRTHDLPLTERVLYQLS